MAQLLRGRVRDHAEKWRDPDSAGEKHSRPLCIFVEAKRTHGPFNPGLAADRQAGYGLLESCVSHARCDYELFVARRTRDRKGVSQSVGQFRMETRQRQVNILSGLECKMLWLFKPKRHCAFGNLFSS